jgi:hypothetical protein
MVPERLYGLSEAAYLLFVKVVTLRARIASGAICTG